MGANPEKDAMWIYTYKTDATGHSAGEIIKDSNGKVIVDSKGNPVDKWDKLPSGINKENVQLTKIYNSKSGLHTDKTANAVVDANGKTDC